jgi:pyridoxal phosphate enzyme (YggS family)
MSIAENLAWVNGRIEEACARSGRNLSEITLIAVSKTVDVDRIKRAYDLGVRHFGENRLQEAIPKIEALPTDIVWHFIGKLQSNKAKKATELFSVLHTIESTSQLREIEKVGRVVDALIEVNAAKEQQKAGIFAEGLDDLVPSVLNCKGVRFRGLMTVGPMHPDPEMSRPIFRRMAELGRRFGAEWLSMGMSADLEVAIQEGSTHLRIGTALFGERA